jgi:hypothetical protein
MEGDHEEEPSEDLPQEIAMNAGRAEGSDRGAKEEPEGEKTCHSEVDVAGAVIPQGGEETDRRQEHGERGALRPMLREAEDIDQERDEDLTPADSEEAADDASE